MSVSNKVVWNLQGFWLQLFVTKLYLFRGFSCISTVVIALGLLLPLSIDSRNRILYGTLYIKLDSYYRIALNNIGLMHFLWLEAYYYIVSCRHSLVGIDLFLTWCVICFDVLIYLTITVWWKHDLLAQAGHTENL